MKELLLEASTPPVMLQYVVRLSVCPFVRLSVRLSVTLRYVFHARLNSWKIISRLRFWLELTPTSTIWSNGNTSKIGVEYGWGHEQKICNSSETVQDRTKITMTD